MALASDILRGYTDTLILRRTYAEWDLATRLPMMPYGTLYWYCTQHGLFSQPLRRK